MYKRKQKSFFDTETKDAYRFKHKEKRKEAVKENIPPVVASEATKLKLAAFTCDKPSQEEPRSSQEHVQWKVSPPPISALPSTQKLTINEMFDIYQATQTPTRNDVFPNKDVLPFLDLDISPANRQADLRRTASLPLWDGRKKRKLGGDRVREMIEKVHQSLAPPMPSSEDFGDDIDLEVLSALEAKQEDASSSYSLDLNEEDFLAIPNDLLEGIDEFSDFEQVRLISLQLIDSLNEITKCTL